MTIAATVAALSVMVAISGTPNSQFPTPKGQQAFTGGGQADQSPAADPAALPVSIERIRDALQRPPALTIPPLPQPSTTLFRSGIEETAPFESVLEGMRRDLALWSGANSVIHPPGSGFPSPLVWSVDVLPLVTALAKKWQTARVRDRISKELAAFCAVNDCSRLEGQGEHTPKP